MVVILFEGEAIVFNDRERAMNYAAILGKDARVIDNVNDRTGA